MFIGLCRDMACRAAPHVGHKRASAHAMHGAGEAAEARRDHRHQTKDRLNPGLKKRATFTGIASGAFVDG